MVNTAAIESLDRGWAREWQALGVQVIPWGWLQDDPEAEAALAVTLARRYGLDGYIANAEDPYEGSANYWKSATFTSAFRQLAPHAPLALSYIGDGYPHRDMPFQPWLDAEAALLPQSYWATVATSIQPSVDAADRAGIPRARLYPTLGTSGFAHPYPAASYVEELRRIPLGGFSVWLLDSTTDDTLRTLSAVA